MQRRSFLKSAAATATVGLAAQPAPAAMQVPAGRLLMCCPRWGMEALPLDTFFRKTKDAGYDGVEMGLPGTEAERGQVAEGLAKHDLQLIAMHFDPAHLPQPDRLRAIEGTVRAAAALKPLKITSHTGTDFHAFEQNRPAFEHLQQLSQQTGVPILHETHRGRFSFAAHVTHDYLRRLPALRLVLDISHWVNVHESLLDTQQEAVAAALAHTDHVHARVGHPEGPQVSDPAAPEWQGTLDKHLSWWDAYVAAQKARNAAFITFTPEFGPPSYLPTLPYTRQPVADQWAVNLFMKDLLRKRYGS